MSSVRFSSALARRSFAVASPPLSAPLSSSARRFLSSSSSSISSSSSSVSTRSPRSLTSASSLLSSRTASARWTGLSSLNLTQSRTMATEIPKIKVKNPVVELDGDEVCLI